MKTQRTGGGGCYIGGGRDGDPLPEKEAGSTRKAERPETKRRAKELPLKAGVDSSGKRPMGNMSKSCLRNTKESHLSDSGNSKQKEDVKLHRRLPDYDDSQCYYSGKEDILRQVAHRIYANPHMPSWPTLKHHLSPV